MEKIFKKFFISYSTFAGAFLLSFSILVGHALVRCFANKIDEIVFYLFTLAICVLGLFISYKKHEKNVMKCLIGSILVGLLFLCIDVTFKGINDSNNSVNTLLNVGSILILILFILNHFAINLDHHSNPYNIFINQLLLIIFTILAISNIIVNGFEYLNDLYNAGNVFLVILITCVESKLDAFREIREEKREK